MHTMHVWEQGICSRMYEGEREKKIGGESTPTDSRKDGQLIILSRDLFHGTVT
jgi:hypothetical protein